MHADAILVPVFVLAGWTALVLLLVGFRRVTAGISPAEFTMGESSKVPQCVTLPNRNYMNLLELPVLFYVVALVVLVVPVHAPGVLPLAWAYVGLRVVHSVIHLTYNHVLHRFAAFAVSNVVLVALWVVVGLQLFAGSAPR